MTGTPPSDEGWFDGLDPGDVDAAAAAIREGGADGPADWPTVAVDAGFAADADEYYDRLHAATVAAARAAAAERERADDQQVIHAVRALDDVERVANELAERVSAWAGSLDADAGTGVAGARDLAEGEGLLGSPGDEANRPPGTQPDEGTGTPGIETGDGEREPDAPTDDRVRGLAERIRDLDDEADALRGYLERSMPTLAPNLAALAGPVLGARLIALAGGLEDLAKLPSGTVQVLGAEDALFAHLRGGAPSPKHGVIFTHEAVRNTRQADRGSAARALAGKLSIAARIDHYSGDRRPSLEADLTDRIERIRARAADESAPVSAGGDQAPVDKSDSEKSEGDG